MKNLIAQSLVPPVGDIIRDSGLPGFKLENARLGTLLSPDLLYYLAAFLAFFYFVWGAFAYIMAQGNKENLAKARARLSFAIIGMIVIFLAYFITRYAAEILQPRGGGPF